MKRLLLAGTIIAVLLAFTGCDTDSKRERFQTEFFTLFDTVTQMVGYADTEEQFQEQVQLVYEQLEEYHQLYDIYNTYEGVQNIKTINENAGKKPVVVDKKILELLLLGKEMYEKTEGRINIAFGSVLSIWHEYRTRGIENPQKAELPPLEALKQAAEHTDIEKLLIDEEASTVYLADAEMSLDVGAIAKGYAAERAAEAAEAAGIDSMLLSIGGNVRAIGTKEGGERWKVGILNPFAVTEQEYVEKVYLEGASLVTSGDYQRYYEVNGKKYHHIINPDTLFPAEYFTAVSVLCKDSGIADALSTSLYNMTYEEGLAFVEGLAEVEAMWIFPDRSIKYSSGFAENLAE